MNAVEKIQHAVSLLLTWENARLLINNNNIRLSFGEFVVYLQIDLVWVIIFIP